jgi:hypothetical protein
MDLPIFVLERSQTLYENAVEINLTESGVHPVTMADLTADDGLEEVLNLPLGYGHTDGTPQLRRAVADWHPGARAENVLVAHGTSEANLLALMALAGPGDHVVVLTPNFMQLDGLCRGLGIEVTRVALRPDEGWQPDLSAVDAAIGPRTRIVTFCDPNNPTGVRLTQASREGLADLSRRRGVWLLADEIYRGSEIDGQAPETSWGLGDRVLVTGGLAKSFGAPALRMGWCIAPPDLVARMHERQDYTTIGTGMLSQALARRALTEPLRSRLLHRGRAILSGGRATVEAWVSRRNGWTWVRPEASGMAFLGYGFDMPSADLVDALRRDTGVFVCAGSWFGIEGHIRIGFGVDPAHLAEGLDRLSGWLDRNGLA